MWPILIWAKDLHNNHKGSCQKHLEGGGAQNLGGGETILIKNGGSVDELGKLWGE